MHRTLQGGVGRGQWNRRPDVLLVQRLLNEHAKGRYPRLVEDGVFGRKTEETIRRYQAEVLKASFADGVVSVHGGTIVKLLESGENPLPQPTPDKKPVPPPPVPTPADGPATPQTGSLTDAQYKGAAALLGCEPAVVHAVTEQECPLPAFDAQGRPRILYEPWWFSKFTHHLWDASHPRVTLAKHLRKPDGTIDILAEHRFPEGQYQRFYEAYGLDSSAALLATSWGNFRLWGSITEPPGTPR